MHLSTASSSRPAASPTPRSSLTCSARRNSIAVYDLARIVAVARSGQFPQVARYSAQHPRADRGSRHRAAQQDRPVRRVAESPPPRPPCARSSPRADHPHAHPAPRTSICLTPDPPRDLHGEYAGCADPHYGRFSVTFSKPGRPGEASCDAPRDLGDDLYRVKGFVPTPEGTDLPGLLNSRPEHRSMPAT